VQELLVDRVGRVVPQLVVVPPEPIAEDFAVAYPALERRQQVLDEAPQLIAVVFVTQVNPDPWLATVMTGDPQ